MIMKINVLGITRVEFTSNLFPRSLGEKKKKQKNPSVCIYHLQTRWLWKGVRALKDILPL